MRKDNIFSKLNRMDYNNRLEAILEKKNFSEDTKNLLLSMLYKIEVGYQDYEIVKRVKQSKSEYIEELMQIIEKDCYKITLVDPESEKIQQLEKGPVRSISNQRKKEILAFPNEKVLLYALWDMQEKSFEILPEHSYLKEPLEKLLNIGYCINRTEVIRDFDGWSWNTELTKQENRISNLLFQNLQDLLGNSFIEQWKKESKEDYVSKMKQMIEKTYGEDLAKKINFYFLRALFSAIKTQGNEVEQKELEKEEKQLIEMEDKAKFISNISIQKREIAKQIREIDKITSNRKRLIKEYIARNERLEEENKIFSISHLSEILQEERKILLEQLQECNHVLDPKKYVAKKQELEQKVELLKIKINGAKLQDVLWEWQEIFLEAMYKRVKKIETKKEAYDFIYWLRYYKFMLVEKGKTIADQEQLKEMIGQMEEELIKTGQNLKLFARTTKDEEVNRKIIACIFDTKIIHLEEIMLEIKANETKKGTICILIYDGDVLEKQIEVKLVRNQEVEIKEDKKIKLFV